MRQSSVPDGKRDELTIYLPLALLMNELPQVWNARGATDIAKIEHELSTMMGAVASGPYLKNLERALRGLDR